MKSNWLDKAIGSVSPRWALERTRARLALDIASDAQRFNYAGASSGRRTDGWTAGATDANVELMGSLVKMRDRSRDLLRNNPYAGKIIEEIVGNTVGTGITPQANTGNPDLDKIIDKEWPYFAQACDQTGRQDIYSMQSLVTRSMLESGEALSRVLPRAPQRDLRIPLQLQLLESDFLDHNRTSWETPKKGYILQGVEFDVSNKPIAYWLFNQHPGGTLVLQTRGGLLSQSVSADQILHMYRQLRPGQVRGVPHLAPVMMALRDLDDAGDAERIRRKIEACLAGIVIQADSDPTLGAISRDQDGNPIEEFRPGMIAYLKPGQDIKFMSPPSVGGYRDYKVGELQQIASGAGVPYENVASDMSQTTYTSYRAGQLGFRNTIESYRWLILIPQFCQPIRKRFIDTLILLNKLPAKAAADTSVNLYGTNWTAPRWESVDPYKDSRAEIQRIRSGTETLWDSISANGYDPREQFARIASTNKLLDELKIVVDSDPRQTNIHGLAQPADSGELEPGTPAKKVPARQRADATQPDQEELDSLQGYPLHDRRNIDQPTRFYL